MSAYTPLGKAILIGLLTALVAEVGILLLVGWP